MDIGDFMQDISVKRRATHQCRVVCGDWPVRTMETVHVINLCALFDVGVVAPCVSNAVHKVPIVKYNLALPATFNESHVRLVNRSIGRFHSRNETDSGLSSFTDRTHDSVFT